MSMYNLIECSDNYAKASGSLWQYHKDISNDNIANSKSFKFKARKIGRTPAKNVEIVLQLIYLGNFWGALEMPLII